MPVLSRLLPPPPPPSPAPAHPTDSTIPHPRISCYNANSVSAYHNTDASKARHNRIVANIRALGLISEIILIQEAHLNHLDTFTFFSILPEWSCFYSNKSNGRAGTVTLISPKLTATHKPTKVPISPDAAGHVLPVLLTPFDSTDHSILVLNLYLATGKKQAARLAGQLRAAAALPSADYNFAGGDLNFVEDAADTTGSEPHKLPVYAKGAWDSFLTHFRLSEAAQSLHTYFTISTNIINSHSSRLDRLFHSYSESDLALFQPLAHIPSIPHSVLTAFRSLDIAEQTAAKQSETGEQRALRRAKTASDHLPLHLSFISTAPPSEGPQRALLPGWVVRDPDFDRIFRTAWKHNPAATAFEERDRFNSAIYTAASATTLLKTHYIDSDSTKLEKITACIASLRLLTAHVVNYPALEQHMQSAPFLHSVFSLDELAPVSEAKIRRYVANLFATTSPDEGREEADPWHSAWTDDSMPDPTVPHPNELPHPPTPAPKHPPSLPRRNRKCLAAQLKARLPSTRTRLRALRASLSSPPTSDPVKMAGMAAGFWGVEWTAWEGTSPDDYLEGYQNRIFDGKSISPPSLTLFKQAIMSSNDSAPGPNGIPYVAYRCLCDIAVVVLRNVLLTLASGVDPPPGFNDGNLFLLPKKETLLPTDTRPLAVNNCDNRIIARVASLSIIPALKEHLHPEQKGFIPGRQGSDHIISLTERFYRQAQGIDPHNHILSIDSRKAFDSISIPYLHAVIDKIGLPDWLGKLVKGLYHLARVTPVFGAKPTGVWIDLRRGVRQGCPLSPLLFAIAMDPLIEQLRKLEDVSTFAFADDLAFSAGFKSAFIPVMLLIDAFTGVSGLGINKDKTVLVYVDSKDTAEDWVKTSSPWDDLQVKDRCLYLGVLIGSTVTTVDVFAAAMVKLRGRARSFYPVTRSFSVQRRIHLFNIFILPLLSYLMQFYILPEVYRLEVEAIMRRIVVPFRTGFKLVHLFQPRSRVAPQVALKDPWCVNAALLGAKGDFAAWDGAHTAPRMGTNSMLIADHVLASVTDTVLWELGYGGKDGEGFTAFQSARYHHQVPVLQRRLIYRSLSLARSNHDRLDDDIDSKLSKLGIVDIPASTLNRHFASLLPSLNSHQRFVQFSLLFNALATDRRLAPVRRGMALAAAAVLPAACPDPGAPSRSTPRARASPLPPPPPPPPPPARAQHPGATRRSARIAVLAEAARVAHAAREAADAAAAAIAAAAEEAAAEEDALLADLEPAPDGLEPQLPSSVLIDTCYLGCEAHDSAPHLFGECVVVADALRSVGRATGYPVEPGELGASSAFQVALLAFPFVGAPLTHLLVAFNWAVWHETRRYFKTLGYPPDHQQAVSRISTTAIGAWLRHAKPEWHRARGDVALGRFRSSPVVTHLSNPFGSAGRRTPEQQSNCVGYTKLLLSRIPAESLVVFTDGSAIPNPGPCGAGFSIWRAGICIAEGSFPLGFGSNNIGEFTAVGVVCRTLVLHQELLIGVPSIYFLSDSKLAVSGINGDARVKTLADLSNAAVEAFDTLLTLIPARLLWIPGHVDTPGNERADARAKAGAIASVNTLACYMSLFDDSIPLPPLLPPLCPVYHPPPSPLVLVCGSELS